MTSDPLPIGDSTVLPVQRLGFALLTQMAFDGVDLRPLWQQLMEKVATGTASAGDGIDLSLLTQLLGDKPNGLAIQDEVLAQHRLFRSPCDVQPPRLRVLALAAAIDMGGNTPIDFLLADSGIELTTLYVVEGTELPSPLPEHDVAIVVASDSGECRAALAQIDAVAPRWPRPLLNPPGRIGNLDRDKLYRLLHDIPGIDIPATIGVSRTRLDEVAAGRAALASVAEGTDFPVIVRPRGSHAGVGLAKLDDAAALGAYLAEPARSEPEFFISRYVDYSSADGQFRKYRIVFVDGQVFACHMAISEQWKIWYLNAGMSFSESKRGEEAGFLTRFDEGFGARHRAALDGMAGRVALDYFTADVAETKDGRLLIFEADNTAVVHNMDSPELFPYKPPQMRAIFRAFAAMLTQRAEAWRSRS